MQTVGAGIFGKVWPQTKEGV